VVLGWSQWLLGGPGASIHNLLLSPIDLYTVMYSSLMRGLGGFFIRRRMDKVAGKKDHIYRAVLHTVSAMYILAR